MCDYCYYNLSSEHVENYKLRVCQINHELQKSHEIDIQCLCESKCDVQLSGEEIWSEKSEVIVCMCG